MRHGTHAVAFHNRWSIALSSDGAHITGTSGLLNFELTATKN
jgi:hypothetical protein